MINQLETISFNDFSRSTEAEVKREAVNNHKVEQKPTQKPIENHNTEKNTHRIEAKKSEKKGLFDRLKELPGKANHVIQRARLWKSKSKHFFFYKKYLDRVQSGLYDRYGSSSPIYENRMKGDPVDILKGPAQEYIQEITHKINLLYQEVLKMSKALEDKTTAEACIKVIKGYCSEYTSDTSARGDKIDQNKLGWNTKLLNATKFKIAKILMRNGERQVYGYTIRNMVQKGYPTPNHLIVTIFVENPEEKPEKQVVTDIFQHVESFEILSNAQKQDIFSISGMTEAVLNKTVGNNVMNEIKLYRDKALQSFQHAEMPNKKDEGRIIDEVWDGIKLSCKELLSRKEYIIDCINVYFDLILRIDNCAYKAINSMLEIENSKMDNKYKRSLGTKRASDTNKYDEDGNLVSTKTDRKIDRLEHPNTGEHYQNKEHRQNINKAFKDANKMSGW